LLLLKPLFPPVQPVLVEADAQRNTRDEETAQELQCLESLSEHENVSEEGVHDDKVAEQADEA